jgi:Flp pilus assembly pilin Flp
MRSRACLMGYWRRSRNAMRHRCAAEEGQALIEYALILALIALLTIGVLQALGGNLSAVLDKVSTSMSVVSNP